MAADLLPYAVLVGLILLGVSIYLLASRSREAELKQALRKCEIALEEAERSRQSVARLHAGEVRRLKTARHAPQDAKFRDAKSTFARLFHPDLAKGDAREHAIRTEVFKQFWEELERIERRT